MSPARPSYSSQRRRRVALHVGLSIVAVAAIVTMLNYLAARHYVRIPWSARTRQPFSPITRTILASVTNKVRVTVFFDRDEPLFDSIWSLLKEYKFANPRIVLASVDQERDPARALAIKNQYRLNAPGQRNLVIFDCDGRTKIVYENQLSELDIKSFASGQTREIRRTHFRGELEFTSALLTVISSRTVRACFLTGHGEHQYDSDDKLMGYSRFARVLEENNIQYGRLSLQGTNDAPADCQLLIVAGPKTPLLEQELDKLDRYLDRGGRMLVLLNYESLFRPTGLEQLLRKWGVAVGRDLVVDQDRQHTITGQDMVVSEFTDHPLMKPLADERLYLVLPRSVSPLAGGSDVLQVEPLARTSRKGRILTDVRPGMVSYHRPKDVVGAVPLMVAVEKGGIRGVSADRGATRMVVVGESVWLGNETLPKLANRDFASHAVNWLLARHELLVGLAPQPTAEYRVNLTPGQMTALRWILLLGLPGFVLVVGLLVQARRRH
ncbi:MAG: GldG family protein [Verrucomicrobia bacterium]|nr:GldG family protein [Verrucomicrobiota bacterium]